MNNYQPVIGLEIHVELKTESKMFCRCSAMWFKEKPNSHVCPICLGLPGALPQPNQKAIEWTIKIASALGCTINKESKFDRKHYFYPDLPKGFQTSQYDQPIGVDGTYSLIHPSFSGQTVQIRRVHLEEDTGKLIHEGDHTLVDYNRCGVPLVEIVTEPDFSDSETVKTFLEELQILVRMLDVSDANMEEGSMRLEPNISLRQLSLRAQRSNPHEIATSPTAPRNDTDELPNYKVEIKNINSFRFAKNAIEYELVRQTAILEKGDLPKQETRGYSEAKGKTSSQRSKEEAHDYRYFPEPDIPPLVFDDEQIKTIIDGIKQTPMKVYNDLVSDGLAEIEAYTLLKNEKKLTILNKLVSEKEIVQLKLKKPLASLATIVINNRIDLDTDPQSIVRSAVTLLTPKQTDSSKLQEAIAQVLASNESAVQEYKKGKVNVIMFLVGQVMKEMKGTAEATIVKRELEKVL